MNLRLAIVRQSERDRASIRTRLAKETAMQPQAPAPGAAEWIAEKARIDALATPGSSPFNPFVAAREWQMTAATLYMRVADLEARLNNPERKAA